MRKKMTQFNNVIDLRPFLKKKTWTVTRFNEAWALHDKYAELASQNSKLMDYFAQTGHFEDYLEAKNRMRKAIELAGYWHDVADYLGQELDNLGGAL